MLSKLKKKLWTEFSLFVRYRDALAYSLRDPESFDPGAPCITCGRWYPIKKLQAGHFIPGRKNAYLFSEVQVNAQCYHCNVGLKGNWPEYLKVMVHRHGQAEVDKMLAAKDDILKFTPDFLEEQIAYYKAKVEDFKVELGA